MVKFGEVNPTAELTTKKKQKTERIAMSDCIFITTHWISAVVFEVIKKYDHRPIQWVYNAAGCGFKPCTLDSASYSSNISLCC